MVEIRNIFRSIDWFDGYLGGCGEMLLALGVLLDGGLVSPLAPAFLAGLGVHGRLFSTDRHYGIKSIRQRAGAIP